MTYKQAQETFNVPRSVICSRISWRVTAQETLGAGRRTVFSSDVEKAIASCLKARAEMGYPVNKEDLFDLVQQYIEKSQLKTHYKGGRPGEEWFRNFMARTSSIFSLKKPELLQKAR